MTYVFYTYDAMGRDISVVVRAESTSDAWSQFRSKYPTNPVDFIDRD